MSVNKILGFLVCVVAFLAGLGMVLNAFSFDLSEWTGTLMPWATTLALVVASWHTWNQHKAGSGDTWMFYVTGALTLHNLHAHGWGGDSGSFDHFMLAATVVVLGSVSCHLMGWEWGGGGE